jgi:hypothetical protein
MAMERKLVIPRGAILGLLIAHGIGCSHKPMRVGDAGSGDADADVDAYLGSDGNGGGNGDASQGGGGSLGTGGSLGGDGGSNGPDGGRTPSKDAQTDVGGFTAMWARTVASSFASSDASPPRTNSNFACLATDRSGNVYVTGDFLAPGTLDFGNNVTVTATYDSYNALLVKYDPSGTPQWAQSRTPGDLGSLAIDASGFLYAVANLPGATSGVVDFGNGVTVVKSQASYQSVLVKYDPAGVPQWAVTMADDAGNSATFLDFELTMDATGNLYAAGTLSGSGPAGPADAPPASDKPAGDRHIKIPAPQPVQPAYAVLVKYDPSGAARWTRTVAATAVSGDSPHSQFASIAADTIGNVYAAARVGSQLGQGTYHFGNGVSAQGPSTVLVKYDPSGAAQWVRTWPADATISSLAVDKAGDVHAAGSMSCGTYDFGNGVTVAGRGVSAGTLGSSCVLLVKYDSSGVARWAQTDTSDGQSSYFNSVAADPMGGVYATGAMYGRGTYDLGNGATLTASADGRNYVMLVKYGPSGIVEWVRSSDNRGSADDLFGHLTVDPSGDVVVAGDVGGSGDVDFGDGVALIGLQKGTGSGWNALLVKYRR